MYGRAFLPQHPFFRLGLNQIQNRTKHRSLVVFLLGTFRKAGPKFPFAPGDFLHTQSLSLQAQAHQIYQQGGLFGHRPESVPELPGKCIQGRIAFKVVELTVQTQSLGSVANIRIRNKGRGIRVQGHLHNRRFQGLVGVKLGVIALAQLVYRLIQNFLKELQPYFGDESALFCAE